MRRAPVLVSLLFVVACGAGAPASKEPSAKANVEEAQPEAKAPRGVRCSDGSCFSCGDAVCLMGYYCAVGKGGRGCAWLPGCVSNVSCACLGPSIKANASCRCEEKGGGVYVVCDGASL